MLMKLSITVDHRHNLDCAQALAALKSLGKNPAGSEAIATPANLNTIISVSEHFKDDADASNEALRCVANALLLVESARRTFVRKEVGGGEAMVDFLEVSLCLLRQAHIFIYHNTENYVARPYLYCVPNYVLLDLDRGLCGLPSCTG